MTEQRWSDLLDDVAEDGTRKRAKNLDFYVLRHHCASLIVDRGGNEYDVSAQLGNSPQVARETYIHMYRDRSNDRVRELLGRPNVSDLDAVRKKRLG